LTSVILAVLVILQFAFLFKSFSPDHNFIVLLSLSGIVFFAKTVLAPLSLVDFGLRESAAVYFAAMIGLSSAPALNAAVIIFLMNVLIPSIIGTYVILIK
jgi:hypothetical protein